MTGLEVRAFRNEDNSVSLILLIPPRRNGEPNFGALARVNRELLMVEPEAFDPAYEEQAVAHHAIEAPMPPAVMELIDRAESDDPQVGSLKAGEAEVAP
jgi:hypothetical protein